MGLKGFLYVREKRDDEGGNMTVFLRMTRSSDQLAIKPEDALKTVKDNLADYDTAGGDNKTPDQKVNRKDVQANHDALITKLTQGGSLSDKEQKELTADTFLLGPTNVWKTSTGQNAATIDCTGQTAQFIA